MKIKLASILFITYLVFNITQVAYAQDQEFKYGARFGIGESTLKIGSSNSYYSRLALTGGIASDYSFSKYVGIGADFMLSFKGGSTDGSVIEKDIFNNETAYKYEGDVRLVYGELPIALNVKYPITDNFSLKVFAGPSINFKFLGLESRTFENSGYNDDHGYQDRSISGLNTTQFDFFYGAGVVVQNENEQIYFLDFRLGQSIGDMGVLDNQALTGKYFHISAGYLF